jgi:uncharacterized membrane protein|uniref:Uncharacterized protein n=1 Tax=Caldisericum exile TaxID=693075 RepID=A0A7C4YEM9_9BACT
MEFKLKEAWDDYFFSGFFAGIVFAVLSALFIFGDLLTFDQVIKTVLLILLAIVLSIVLFITACKIKKV